MCVRKCIDKVSFDVNLLSHTLHSNGRSPLCISKCLANKCLIKLVFMANHSTFERTVSIGYG